MNNTKTFNASLICIVATVFLGGCQSSGQVFQSSDEALRQAEERRASMLEKIKQSETSRIRAQEVDRPYIAGNIQPISREAQMPPALRRAASVTAMFSRDPVDLGQALQQLSDATGMSLTATPDALLPPSAFNPRITAVQGGSNPILGPARVKVTANNVPLWQLFDDVARQASVSWRPVPGGAEFFRLETKVFDLSAMSSVANTVASLGKNAGTNQAFESQSKTSFGLKDQNLIAGLQATLEAMLTVSGKVTISAETRTIIVTDTAPVMQRVSRYIEDQNRILNRRIRLVIEAIDVRSKDQEDIGIDWDIIQKTTNRALNLSSPGSLVSATAGAVGFNRSSGSMSGTDLVVSALNEVGTVVSRRSFPLTTKNGRPVTLADRNTFSYVDQVQATSVASSALVSTPAPTVTQKEITTGTFLTVIPTAGNDGIINMLVHYDLTSLQALRSFTVGSSSSQVTVQQPSIDGSGNIQELPVRSGITTVLGGFQTTTASTTNRRLANGLPMLFGGSDSTSRARTTTVLLVTAVSEEGI